MENTISQQTSRVFLLKWVLANIFGLPVLLGAYRIGFFLTLGLAIMADGGSVGYVPYIFIAIILAICGAVLGGWLGLMQWLALRKEVMHARKWILASSLAVGIGALLGWVLYLIIFATIVTRADGIYFSFAYEYIAFGISLGLCIGLSQWLVLKHWVHKAEWWILAVPTCFTLAMLFANFYRVSAFFLLPIHWLRQGIAVFFPNVENMHVLAFFALASALIALVSVGLVTGLLLEWLLRLQRKEEAS